MKIQAVRFIEKGYYTQPFVFGGEDGPQHYDKNVRYRGSLQNYVIETGSDVILVDTGMPKEVPNTAPKEGAMAYLGRWRKDYVSALAECGYKPEQVTKILITHKHADHTGEVRSFPNAKVYVNRIELETDEMKALAGHKGITPIDFKDGPYHNFKRSEVIVPGVRMIPAPGHTFGNSIVIVEDGDLFYMIHGDITYVDEAMYADRLSVVYDDIHAARSTQNAIRQFIKENPTVYIGTHSPQGPENLEAKRVMDLEHPTETIWPKDEDFVFDAGTGKYVCSICGYVYDPAVGDPTQGIPAGTRFEDLPENWHCPRCKQGKEKFNKA